MTDPMSTEELQACRERAEAATGLSPSDVRGGAFTWDGDEALLADVVATADALAALRADVPRLLATIAARDEEIAALRAKVDSLEESAAMACITPADDCDCAGCLYAAEVNEREEEEGQ